MTAPVEHLWVLRDPNGVMIGASKQSKYAAVSDVVGMAPKIRAEMIERMNRSVQDSYDVHGYTLALEPHEQPHARQGRAAARIGKTSPRRPQPPRRMDAMTPDPLDLDAVEALCAKATEGPWQIWDGPAYLYGGKDLCIGAGPTWLANMDERACGVRYCSANQDCDVCSLTPAEVTEEQQHNAAFIAAARTLVPQLVARIRELEADAARLDWLESQVVNVRKDARYGSWDMFWSSPVDQDGGEPLPSDIRKKIDAARAGS